MIMDEKKLIETYKCISPSSSGKNPIKLRLIPDKIRNIFHNDCVRKKVRDDIKYPKTIIKNPLNIIPLLNIQDTDGFN